MKNVTNIKQRFATTFLANLVRGSVTLAIGILLARVFGATDYGRIAYLTATFMAIKQLLDLGTSAAFFTFISQQSKSIAYLGLFWTFFFAKYFLAVAIIFVILPHDLVERIWNGEQDSIIALALGATALQFDVWPVAAQMAESQRKTVSVQLLFMATMVAHLLFVLVLYLIGGLNIEIYFLVIAVLWLVAAAVAVILYEPCSISGGQLNIKNIFHDYVKFCLPIAPFFVIGFFLEMLDRWMLQAWGGSKQQAYLAVAQQLSSVSILVTVSLVKLFWKEMAEALHRKDTTRAKQIYFSTKRGVFFVSVFISAGIIPWSDYLIVLLFGSQYSSASFVFTLMMLCSIHQSLGQLEGAFIMASGQTKIGFFLNLLMFPFAPIASYFLLAPDFLGVPGFKLGAEGIAIKLLIFQLISVNILGYLVCRSQNWQYEWKYQITTIIFLFLLGALGKLISLYLGFAVIHSLIFYAFSYTALVAVAMMVKSDIFRIHDILNMVFRRKLSLFYEVKK